MKKAILIFTSVLLLGLCSCSDDGFDFSLSQSNTAPTTEKRAGNQVMRSLAGTIWNFTIQNGSNSWQADVVFYPDGTTMYEEPEYPGLYTSYGTWRQVGNTIYYDLSTDIPDTGYYFTGSFSGNTMAGTYTFGTGPQAWTALQY